MQTQSADAVEVCPFDAPLGAEIRGVDLSKPLDAAAQKKIVQAWYDHLGLLIRNQALTDPQLIAFSRIFGDLEMAPPNKSGSHWIEGYPELACISNITKDGEPIGSLGKDKGRITGKDKRP